MAFARRSAITICAGISLGFSMAASAALTGPDGGLVYQDAPGLYWLANANLAATETFGVAGISVSGQMTWDKANEWIAAMNAFDGGAGYLGHNDWRLPNTNIQDPTCTDQHGGGFASGANCTGSELGRLFYTELSGAVSIPNDPTFDADIDKFSNVQLDGYWSNEFALDATSAQVFVFRYGLQGPDRKVVPYYVLPVRDAAAVPAPGALWLLGTGLLALGGRAYRRSAMS